MLAFDQQGLGIIIFGQVLGITNKHIKSLIYFALYVTSLVPEDLEIILDQFTTFGDILSCLHLISSQHPYFNVGSD